MERQIGEIFDYNGKTLKVAEAKKYHPLYPCCDCYFLLKGGCADLICSEILRDDKRDVYFKEVKK